MRRGLACYGLVLSALVVAAPAARATNDDDIKAAIGGGVAYLKRTQRLDGTWPFPGIGAPAAIGVTALATLTLVECDVSVTDPAVLKGAAAVRVASAGLKETYSLALAIMLLDRLGDPDDEPLIHALGVRLGAGQLVNGSWGYDCPLIGGLNEVRRLAAIAQQKNVLIAKGEPARPFAKGTDPRRELASEIRDQLALLSRLAPRTSAADMGNGDNSCTQFAVLGLWVAHRHRIPVGQALERAEMHFRDAQDRNDCGWGYKSPDQGTSTRQESNPQMTCSGLLALAASHGWAAEAVLRTEASGGKEAKPAKGPRRWEPERDPAIRFALASLSTAIGHPVGKRVRGRPPIRGRAEGMAYYFLWSLERVAVVYGLETIGRKDWYAWGSEILHVSQLADGSWQGEYPAADTCFALLFLRKANFAPDLAALLKGKVEDPRTVRLKVGGVGGETLPKGLKPGVRLTEAPATQPPPDKPPAPAKETPKPRPATSPGPDAEVERLTKELIQAPTAERSKLLAAYRVGQNTAYTTALAAAVPQLTGPAQTQVRDALTQRLAYMTARTLRDKLRDADGEIRRSAALACAMRDEREHVPDLIRLLEDPAPPVARAAHTALKALTGQDFGPAKGAVDSERATAVAAWQAWWQKSGGKRK
jgi:hypothetical protein